MGFGNALILHRQTSIKELGLDKLKRGFFRAESRNRLSAIRNNRYFGWGGDVTAARTVYCFAKCGNDRHMASFSYGRR